MPIYVTRGRYSAESIKNLVANPEDRLPAVRILVEAAGAKLLNFYVTLGHYDFLVITEAPSAFARARVPSQSATSKIEFQAGETSQPGPIGRMPPSWTSPRLNTVYAENGSNDVSTEAQPKRCP